MAILYRPVIGLGVLITLSREMRQLINAAYFSERTVLADYSLPTAPATDGSWNYHKRCSRSLLLVSHAIYDEAHHVENLPGITLRLPTHVRLPPEPPPKSLRLLLTAIWLMCYRTRGPLNLADYPALEEVQGNALTETGIGAELRGGECIDKLLKGEEDEWIISEMKKEWGRTSQNEIGFPFDWRVVPPRVKLVVDLRLFVLFGNVVVEKMEAFVSRPVLAPQNHIS